MMIWHSDPFKQSMSALLLLSDLRLFAVKAPV